MINIVAFSGGVDSTALALLMPDATPVFTDTGWEFDELYQHIDNFGLVTGREVVRLKQGGGLPEYIESAKFMPNHGARFCTRLFKIDPMNEYMSQFDKAVLNIALRADEPGRVGNTTEMDNVTIRYPLREWGYTRIDVVRVCLEHELLPRYPLYMARGGCKGCFYKRRSEVVAMKNLTPEILDELQVLEESVQDERGKFFYMFPNVGMSIRDLRRQGELFTPEQIYKDAGDTSDYGANCGLFCNR